LAKPKVVIPKPFYDRYKKVQALLEPVAEVEFSAMGFGGGDMAKFKDQIATAEAIFGGGINEEILNAAPMLKIVANYGVGYDSNDVAAMTRHKVYLTNTPGVLSDAVADLTVALMLAVNRKMIEADKYTREGGWGRRAPGGPAYTSDMRGKTVGIIGLGRIGYETGKRCVKGFDMNIVYYDLYKNKKAEDELGAKQKPLEDVLKESDYVVVHTDLNQNTRKLIGDKQLRMMKKTAFIVNTARGPIIDQAALAKALNEGVIAGAGLDVFEIEPCPPNDPILKAKNTVLAPHMASATEEAREGMAVCNAENVVAVLKGQIPPPNAVPEQRGMIFKR
jgi:glyoxylate reductase